MVFKFDRTAINLVNITLTIPYVLSLGSAQRISANVFKKELDHYSNYSNHLVGSAIGGIPMFFFAVLAAVVVINVINKSSRFVQILDYVQLIAVTLYLDVQYPPILEQFLAGFRVTLLAFTKNMVNIVPYTFSPPKFIFYHIDTNLFRN